MKIKHVSKWRFLRSAVLFAAILPFMIFLCLSCSDDPGEPNKKEYILIYNGRSADPDSVKAVSRAANELGRNVEYISQLQNLPDMLKHAEAFVIGGTIDNTGYILDPLILVQDALENYIHAGGKYFGICGGAYIVSIGSNWEDGYEEGLGIVNAESFEYDSKMNDPQIITVSWLGAERSIYYLNGPAFNESDLPAARILAYYKPGIIAAFITEYGTGKIAISGPHPEADETWLIDDPEPLDAGKWKPTWDLFVDMFEDLLSDD